jgi:hypothetical protein
VSTVEKFGHPPHLCWNLPSNAQSRPEYWRGPVNPTPGVPTAVAPRPFESGNVSVDQHERDASSELSMAVGQLDSDDLRSLDVSLKAMGLSLK